MDTIELKIKSSDLAFSGEFKHFFAHNFCRFLELQKCGDDLFCDLTSQNLDLDELLAINSVAQNVRSGSAEKWQMDSLKNEKNLSRQRFTDLLLGTFEARIGNLNYKNIDAKNFTGQLGFNHNVTADNRQNRSHAWLARARRECLFEEKPRLKARITTKTSICKRLSGNATILGKRSFGKKTCADGSIRVLRSMLFGTKTVILT